MISVPEEPGEGAEHPAVQRMLCIYTSAQSTGHFYNLVLSNRSEGGAGDTQISIESRMFQAEELVSWRKPEQKTALKGK